MQPKKYYFDQHDISSKNIDSHAYYIIEKLKSKGYEAYLVGGGVRDLLLKQVPKDFDIATSAEPEEVRAIFKNCILIGRRFRLAHIRFGKKLFEVSTFRSGDISSSELILRDNEWGSAEEDALRRDFTINGLFYDIGSECIIDYVNGFEDAKNKCLKTIGDPKIRFIRDPVRMLRLIKFQARFNFNIDNKTLLALETCKKEIIKSSQARILEELLRMLESGASESFFKLLNQYDFLSLLLPKLASLKNKDATYKLLKEADIFVCKHNHEMPDRSILMSCLIFPILDEKIKIINERIHLGKIAEITKQVISDFFHPFFSTSKKIKTMIFSVLLNQYRFIPANLELKQKRIRCPKDPFFPLAMQFFKLRCMDNSELLNTYNLWHEHIITHHPKKKRRYGKRYSR